MRKTLLATTSLVAVAAFMTAVDLNAQVATISTTDLLVSGVSSSAMVTSASPTYIPNDGESFIAIARDGTTKTATIRTAATQINAQGIGPITLSDQVLNIPSGTGVILAGPFPEGRWNNTQYDTVKIDFSAPVSLTVVRVPQ